MLDDTFSPTRMPHGAHVLKVYRADELRVERRPARCAERIPDIQMILNELGPRVRAEIEDRIVPRVDAVCPDRDDDVAVAGKNRGNVIVALEAQNRTVTGRAGPFEKCTRALKTGHVAPVEKY